MPSHNSTNCQSAVINKTNRYLQYGCFRAPMQCFQRFQIFSLVVSPISPNNIFIILRRALTTQITEPEATTLYKSLRSVQNFVFSSKIGRQQNDISLWVLAGNRLCRVCRSDFRFSPLCRRYKWINKQWNISKDNHLVFLADRFDFRRRLECIASCVMLDFQREAQFP